MASSICALTTVVLFVPGMVAALDPQLLLPRSGLVTLTAAGTFLAAGLSFLLGVGSLIDIAISGGKRTGYGFAAIGVATPFVLFVGLLYVPAFGGVKHTSYSLTCGTNLSQIGKAMLIYANDYGDDLPCAGGRTSQWTGRVADWSASDRYAAYGVSPDGTGGQVSISASLYLLVKHMEVTPETFLCGGTKRHSRESGVTEFKVDTYPVRNKMARLVNFWDFGPNPPRHCSYAYHMVYGPSRLTVYSEAGMPIAADRNPWMDSPFAKAKDFAGFQPDIAPFNGTSQQALAGNTFRHRGEGQNVLFLDSHVEFKKRSFCGLEDDNIYTSWNDSDKVRGVPAKLGNTPANTKDSLLVNDPVGPSR